MDHTAPPGDSSHDRPDMRTPEAGAAMDAHAQSRDGAYDCHVTSDRVASAALTLKNLLRKQTLAYQSHVMETIRRGDVSELKRFLEQKEGKINVNFFDKEGQTALHQSCFEGNVELVKVLVKHGADIKLTNKEGWNALHVATYGGHRDIALFLISLHSR